MSTRANIEFRDGLDSINIMRGHDGFPDNILPDIVACIDNCRYRWDGVELGYFVSSFLGMHYDKDQRIQDYEVCIGYKYSGDESYRYWVAWNEEKEKYEYGVKAR